jgi:hypothetical protein
MCSRRSRFTAWTGHGHLHNSKVGWFAFVGGVTGYFSGMLMIWWMNAVDYPIIVGGKPMFSPFAAFPPSYELTILFGAFGALGGMLFLNRLPRCIIRCSRTAASQRAQRTTSFSS